MERYHGDQTTSGGVTNFYRRKFKIILGLADYSWAEVLLKSYPAVLYLQGHPTVDYGRGAGSEATAEIRKVGQR